MRLQGKVACAARESGVGLSETVEGRVDDIALAVKHWLLAYDVKSSAKFSRHGLSIGRSCEHSHALQPRTDSG